MAGIGTVRQAIGVWRGSVAMLVAGLLLAACSGHPDTGSPQAATTPAVVSTGRMSALGDLNGLAPAQVAALIGDPDLRRVDPPVEVRQYRNANCVLKLYFYDSGSDSRMRKRAAGRRNARRMR